MSDEQINESSSKKLKINPEQQQDSKEWIVIKKKTTPLTITIADHSKLNRFYSHKSIQKYIRYLYTQTCPNPMWLSIKRQSQIQHIFYFDIEIEDYLFENMLEQQSLSFLGRHISFENKGVFKQQRLNRYVWDSLLIYDQEEKFSQEQFSYQAAQSNEKKKMSKSVYQKYLSNILTPQQLKQNLYPDPHLPLYQKYHSIESLKLISTNQTAKQKAVPDLNPKQQLTNEKIDNTQNINNTENEIDKNLILVIDCEMVTTCTGFELARCTIVNYEEQVIFDEFFKPTNPVLNYNTQFSGITKEILDPVTNSIADNLHPFLSNIITHQTILIGHSLQNDFYAMQFHHSKIVDTSVLFRRKNGSKMKLRNLADKILNRKIQSFTHDSKEDCLATLHLVQARLQNDQSLDIQKQYHLLRDLVKAKHGILIVDYDIQNLRQYSSIHFEKVSNGESPTNIAGIIKKYSDKNQVSVPKTAFTRFEKPNSKDWEIYYQEIDAALQTVYDSVPQGTVLMLNFQVNEIVRIVPFEKEQYKKPRSRPFFVPIPKN